MLTSKTGTPEQNMEQPEEDTDGKTTVVETIEVLTPNSTSSVAKEEERSAEKEVESVVPKPQESVPEPVATWLRRHIDDSTEDSTERNDLSRDVVVEPSLAASGNVVSWHGNWAESWPARNDSSGSAASTGSEIGPTDQPTHENVLMSETNCSIPQDLVNRPAEHSNHNSASNGESSIAKSRESKNTSLNEASPKNGSAPASTHSRKGQEPEIAPLSKQNHSSEMPDFTFRRPSTPYIGTANAVHVATQYMNRKESIDIINNEALHTVGSVPLNPSCLAAFPPGTISAVQNAAAPYHHYHMDGQRAELVQRAQQRLLNNPEKFVNIPSSTMPPPMTGNQSGQPDIKNERRVERSDVYDPDEQLPSEILDDMEKTLELLRDQDQQRLLNTENLLRQTRLLKQAQMASKVRGVDSISTLDIRT
jgi:hypothetical protein